MTPNTPMTELSEKVEEMLAGLEGVTPGPWEAKTQEEWDHGFNFFGGKEGAFTFPIDGEPLDVAHISRCDPDTMRQILTLAKQALSQSLRAPAGEAVGYISAETLASLRHAGGERPDTFWHIYGGEKDGWNDVALYTSPPSEGVKVKPLEWEDCTDGDMGHLSDTVIGRYIVEQDRLASKSFQLRFETVRYGREENLTLKEGQLSVDQAKAAAQSDYDTRIRSALSGDTL